MDPMTAENRVQWMRKPSLRKVYQDLYRRMAAECVPGLTLEVGGGSGNFKEFLPEVITSDISPATWLDLVADAQHLPISAGVLANIVMFDVLHHLEFPLLFLQEAERTLIPGGRLVMVEPAITPASWPFYRVLHAEPVMLRCDPLSLGRPSEDRKPYDANQAVPTLLFGRFQKALLRRLPELTLKNLDWVSLFVYPLTGGFKPWTLIPATLVEPLLRIEYAFPAWMRRWLAFRIFVVLEKRI